MRKTTALPLAFLGVIAIALATGCANGNLATAGGAPSPAPSPTNACTMPPGETNIQMVFPQNGAVAAPNLEGIVIAVAPNPLPTNWFFYSSSGAYGSTWGTQSIGFFSTPAPASVTPTPSPLPVPSDTPLFPNPIYESASNGIFANSSPQPNRVTIYLANAGCYPGLPLSTFTTATVDTPTPTPTPT